MGYVIAAILVLLVVAGGVTFFVLNATRRSGTAEPGVDGELWSVHGGGFYRVVKYAVAPPRLPDTLHWFKWEAYATWWTGFTLLWLVYYVGARTMLVDPEVARLPIPAAVGIGLGTLAGAWVVYDGACRSP